MERMVLRPHSRHMEFPEIHIVSPGSPFAWLYAGPRDFGRSWPINPAYTASRSPVWAICWSPTPGRGCTWPWR